MAEVDVSKAGEENSTIRQMREALDGKNKELDDLKVQLKEIERKEMDEKTRLQSERDEFEQKAKEADAIRNELGQFQSKFEAMVVAELATIPEEQRPLVERLLGNGSWADRYESLQAARQLVQTSTPAPPAKFGTITTPVVPPATPPQAPAAQPLSIEDIKNRPLNSFLSQPKLGKTPPGA